MLLLYPRLAWGEKELIVNAHEIPNALFLELVGRLSLKVPNALFMGSFSETGSIRWMKDGLTTSVGIHRKKQMSTDDFAELEISHGPPLMVPVIRILSGLREDPTFLRILARCDELYVQCQDYKKLE